MTDPFRTVTLVLLASTLAHPVLAQGADAEYPTTVFAEGSRSATVTAGGISATVAAEGRLSVDPTTEVPVLTVRVGKQMVQEVLGTPSRFAVPVAEASIAEMDPSNDFPEVYFTNFTGGAHCCEETFVVEQRGAEWVSIPVGAFDGGGGELRDADGDGIAEIVAIDDAFLYRFDAYAGSVGPLQIIAIEGGVAVDVSAEPRFIDAHRAWTAEIETFVTGDDRWTMPGWAAGWVASKIRSGEGAQAWAELEANWPANFERAFEICLDGGDPSACRKGRTATVPFPEALRLFLEERGYPV